MQASLLGSWVLVSNRYPTSRIHLCTKVGRASPPRDDARLERAQERRILKEMIYHRESAVAVTELAMINTKRTELAKFGHESMASPKADR